MRTIKFRAWSSVMKQMLDWNTVQYIAQDTLFTENQVNKPMQYTGLLDKNGVEIYEGDLILSDEMYHDLEDGVAINALPDGKIYEVVFKDGGFFAGDEFLCEITGDWEIVGNIYENPDLLSQEKPLEDKE